MCRLQFTQKSTHFLNLSEFLSPNEPWISSNSGVLLSDIYPWPNKIKRYYSFLLIAKLASHRVWGQTASKFGLIHTIPKPTVLSKYSNIYGKTCILEFCSTGLVGEIRKWVYGTYPEVTPLSYYFLTKPVVLWKLTKGKHFEKYVFFSLFLTKMCVFGVKYGPT